MNVEKLILLVKEEHQAIYDASDSDHRNTDYIAKIAQEMDVGTWRALLFLLTLMMMLMIMTMIKHRNPNISDKVVVVVVVCP